MINDNMNQPVSSGMDSIPVAIPISQPYQSGPMMQQPEYSPPQPMYMPGNGGMVNQGNAYLPTVNPMTSVVANPLYPQMYTNSG